MHQHAGTLIVSFVEAKLGYMKSIKKKITFKTWSGGQVSVEKEKDETSCQGRKLAVD